MRRGITLLSPLFDSSADGVRGSNKAMRQAEPAGTNDAATPHLNVQQRPGWNPAAKTWRKATLNEIVLAVAQYRQSPWLHGDVGSMPAYQHTRGVVSTMIGHRKKARRVGAKIPCIVGRQEVNGRSTHPTLNPGNLKPSTKRAPCLAVGQPNRGTTRAIPDASMREPFGTPISLKERQESGKVGSTFRARVERPAWRGEMDDNKFWLKTWLIITCGIIALVVSFLVWDYRKDTKMAELGYQKVTVIGQNIAEWQKVGQEAR